MSTRCVKAVRAVRSVSVVTSPDMCHGEGLAGNGVMCHGEGLASNDCPHFSFKDT